ncbi:MAG: NAD(P)-dependent alcohol dehydrogenase [Actinomycetota bacterium]
MTEGEQTMSAAVRERYGGPEELRIEDRPRPEPAPDQVLIEVAATSVNLSDWESLTGSPFYSRIAGLRRPRHVIPGSDIAGTVVEVGTGVTDFGPGDEVYGDNLGLLGGFAEYAVAPPSALALKPPELSFVVASALPQSGPIALQGTARAEAGARVLINGGGGATGHLAIQLAKRAGAHVTAVDTAAKLDLMRGVGADEIIDYRTDDFTRDPDGFDLVLDLVAHRSMFAYHRALAPGGRYLCVGGTTRAIVRSMTVGAAIGRLTGRRLGLLAVRPGPEHFAPLAELVAAGEIEVLIDRVVDLEDTAAAIEQVGTGRSLGTVVVQVR